VLNLCWIYKLVQCISEETAEAFRRIFGKGGTFGGATDELAKTFEGTLSMIGDKIFQVQRNNIRSWFLCKS
jgi:hypothetical protein